MDQRRLTELLQQRREEISEPTRFCPEGHVLAALLDRETVHPDHERLERHLADCSYCRARTTVLARFGQSEGGVTVPKALLARAKQLDEQPSRRRFSQASKWATAAVVTIALFAILNQVSNRESGSAEGLQPIPGETRQIRNIDTAYPGPIVLYPAEGSIVQPGELTVRWTRVPGSLYYDVRLVNAEGLLLWQQRVKETAADLSGQLELVSGAPYFVRVDAYLAEAKSVSSGHVKFIYQGNN